MKENSSSTKKVWLSDAISLNTASCTTVFLQLEQQFGTAKIQTIISRVLRVFCISTPLANFLQFKHGNLLKFYVCAMSNEHRNCFSLYYSQKTKSIVAWVVAGWDAVLQTGIFFLGVWDTSPKTGTAPGPAIPVSLVIFNNGEDFVLH